MSTGRAVFAVTNYRRFVAGQSVSLETTHSSATLGLVILTHTIAIWQTTNSILANVGRTLGPAVAAYLAHSYGLGWCFVVNAVSFAVLSAVLAAVAGLMLDIATPDSERSRSLGV